MQMALEPLLVIKNSTLETSLKKMQRFYIARFKKMANSFMDIFLLMIVIYGTIYGTSLYFALRAFRDF